MQRETKADEDEQNIRDDRGARKYYQRFDVVAAKARLRAEQLRHSQPSTAKTASGMSGLEILRESYGGGDSTDDDEETEREAIVVDIDEDDIEEHLVVENREEMGEDEDFTGSVQSERGRDNFREMTDLGDDEGRHGELGDVGDAEGRLDLEVEEEEDRLNVNQVADGMSDFGTIDDDMDLDLDSSLTATNSHARNTSEIWRSLGFTDIDIEMESVDSDTDDDIDPLPIVRNGAIDEDGRHIHSVTDFNNRLYDLDLGADDVTNSSGDFYFTYNLRDVKAAMRHYRIYTNSNNKDAIVGTEEILTKNSSPSRLTSNKRMPRVVFFNQIYAPKDVNSDGLVVGRCTKPHPTPGRTSCPGSILINLSSGEVRLHRECVHESARDEIARQLIIRKLAILTLNRVPPERQSEAATELAEHYEISEQLNSDEKMRRQVLGVLRIRSSNHFPPIFDWHKYKKTTCIYDNSGNFETTKNCLLVWKAHGADDYLRQAQVVNFDGKFSGIPRGFQQLYCMSMKDPDSDSQIPLLFALATSKTESTYTKLFELARQEGLLPSLVYSDFEIGAMNAILNVWPQTKVLGCWRHWKCALLKKLRTLLKKDEYTADQIRLMKSLYGLSFAPLDKLEAYYDDLKQRSIGLHPKMIEFYAYLDRQWFGPRATFKPDYWHCLDRASLGHDFTNNGSEQLFSKYKRLFDHSNYKVLRCAVTLTVNWTLRVYSDCQNRRLWLNKRRTDRSPLYKDADFHRVVERRYNNYADFNAAIHSYMHDPKLFH